MPEWPDVAVLKQYFDSTSLHQRIESVELRGDELREAPPESRLGDRLVNHSFTGSRLHGKFFFASTDGGAWLMLHFGMTGSLEYYKRNGTAPDHTKLLLGFESDYELAYVNVRRLGMIACMDDPDTYLRDRGIGPDVMSEEFDLDQFRELCSESRAMIKSLLTDQSKMAGIGNVYADEILFQTGVHPRTPAADLDGESVRNLYRTTREVLETSFERGADPDDLPGTFLIPHREEDAECPDCSTAIEAVKVSGRSTYFCPNCQPAEGE